MPTRHGFVLGLLCLCAASCGQTPTEGFDPKLRVDDDFDAGLDAWTVYNAGDAAVSVAGGQLIIEPDPNTAWYANFEAVHVYQLVQGDFAVTSRVEATNLAGGPAAPNWRLGGLLIRDPSGGPVDAYHGALGTVGSWMSPQMVVEYKSTVGGGSTLGFISNPSGTGDLRLCRAEGEVQTLFRADGETDWTVVDARPRGDLPAEVAVGPMAYAFTPVADFRASFDAVEFVPISTMSECETAVAQSGSSSGGAPGSSSGGPGDSSSGGAAGSSSGGPVGGSSTGGVSGGSSGGAPGGASLPVHDPLEIVIVSDTANPTGLPDAELTQAGDLQAAVNDPNSGINVGSILEVDSDCVDGALNALGAGTVDVVIYFAHQPAQFCGGGSAQASLTTAFEDHLQVGGGVVVFHHGIFEVAGKEAVMDLLGGQALEFEWQPSAGQSVINVATSHFVTTNAVDYASTIAIGDAGLGIPFGDYDAINNVPDERYPNLALLTEPGEQREILFVSDYDGSQILGYDLQRPGWAGRVVAYQPGEYEPNALDLDGPNFQILANAIYYVGTYDGGPLPGGTTGGGDDGGGTTVGDGGGTTTAGDGGTTAAGDDGGTTVGPGGTTSGPGSTTSGPGGTTSGPGGTTSGPGGESSSGGDPSGGGEACVAAFDGTGDIALLTDEFDDPAGLECWQLRHEVEGESAQYTVLDVDASTAGQLTAVPIPSGWYSDHSGVFMFKEVAGDFILEVSTASVSLADPSEPPNLPFSSAGVLVRDPVSSPGTEDWIMWDVGAQWAAGPGTIGKNTNESGTALQITNSVASGRLRICRLGAQIILARRLDGDATWTVAHEYIRGDLPSTLQAGVAASAWGGSSGAGPETGIDPDLFATWDYARFSPITVAADCTADAP